MQTTETQAQTFYAVTSRIGKRVAQRVGENRKALEERATVTPTI